MIGNANCLPIVDTKNERDPSRAILGGNKPLTPTLLRPRLSLLVRLLSQLHDRPMDRRRRYHAHAKFVG